MFSKQRGIVILPIIFILLISISGCLNQKTTPEKMYDVMEKVVAAEESFESQQDPLVHAEKKEKQIYDKIISLGMKDYDQIVNLSDEALQLVEDRKTLMAKETESIEKSKVQFEKLVPFIDKLEDESMKKDAAELYNVMMERYKFHSQLQETYSQAVILDKELYQMFKTKDLTIEQIENQINKINETYTEVYKINEQFNLKTQKYNELKLSFYKKAGFKIENKQ